MKAMILAAGEGTRLRPLTGERPKPLFPIANRPVIHHVLDKARRAGIREVVVNLHYRADEIKAACGDGSRWGIKIHWSVETQLMGTAGGVKKMEHVLKDAPFIILSGDGVSDVDPLAVLAFHKKRKALGTMVTKAVDYRFEYGITLSGRNGRITKFIEKPSWGDVFSNTANTGIYLFEPTVFKHIPSGRPYDFGKELWPKFLKEGRPIYAMKFDGYWCDVGNLSEYRRAEKDALDGNVKLQMPGKELSKGVWVDEGASIDPKAELRAPCIIGKGVRIAAGAEVGPYTVVGDDSEIGEKATLKNCIMWEQVSVGKNVHLTNCIVGQGGKVTEDITVYEAALLNVRQ